MSRAFVREDDQGGQDLPERAISEHPNLVTANGLAQLDERVHDLQAQLQAARAADDRDLVARTLRDLRYFQARRGSARLVQPAASPDAVRFGVVVTLGFADGSRRELQLVGEDEADPAAGRISWVSPLAQSLLGLKPGDSMPVAGQDAQVLSLA
ncbi:MAG TPA: GreA/GreB family elongation factor [Steroidobacteraceae bacterium]|jgi:transcription elongation GreA/GreB family factor|nr:GreA/GreB family elongation factor [Steroidobacteraceae bacterium]